MTDIIIQGIGGRMGHVLCEMIAQREDCRVIAGIDMKDGEQNGIPVYDSLEKLDGKGDVVIDFSSPAAVEKALPYCEAHKLPIVVCTTGLSEELQLKVVQLSRSIPVFKSAFMSMGINVLSELSTPVSMAFRHFGNILSGTVISTLLYWALASLSHVIFGWLPGFLSQIQLFQIGIPAFTGLYFDWFGGCIQAFIFCTLTTIFIKRAAGEE